MKQEVSPLVDASFVDMSAISAPLSLCFSVLSDRTLKGKDRPDNHVEFVPIEICLCRTISGSGDEKKYKGPKLAYVLVLNKPLKITSI